MISKSNFVDNGLSQKCDSMMSGILYKGDNIKQTGSCSAKNHLLMVKIISTLPIITYYCNKLNSVP